MAQETPDLKSELEELKAQVRALTKAQAECAEAAASEPATGPATGPATEASTVSAAATLAAGADLFRGETSEFDELFEHLKEEVEGLNPLTCLAVFGLGVLVGRLLTN